MNLIKRSLFIILIPLSIFSQIIWNDPPQYIWYENGKRWIEVILPTPQNLKASTINMSNVILTWDEYWTENFLAAYKNRMGYDALPNRFSLYRQNITDGDLQLQAIPSVAWDKTEYIDTNVDFGKEYLYKILASDQNYLIYGGLARWSPRSASAYITVGVTLNIEDEECCNLFG